MKRTKFLKSTTLIDNNQIMKSCMVNKINLKNLIIKLSIPAFILLIILFISFFKYFKGPYAEDLNWNATNLEINSIEDAKKTFGSDFLFVNFNYENVKKTYFRLNFDKGKKENKDFWNYLKCDIYYNDEDAHSNGDIISLQIFLPNNKSKIDDWYKYKGTKKEHKGITIEYSDMSDVKGYNNYFKYTGCAKFKYGEFTYLLNVKSNVNKNVLWYYIELLLK